MGVTSYCFGDVLVDGAWTFPGDMEPNPDYYPEYWDDPQLWVEIMGADSEYWPEPEGVDRADEPKFRPRALFESDSKELAAILVGSSTVIRSSEPYTPVTPRRGIPSDLSEPLEKWLRRDADDVGFHANWFTLAESNAFGWTSRLMKRQAAVHPRVAELFRGCPRGFPSDRWPADIPISISTWIGGGYVEVEWIESYAEIVPDFYGNAIPRLAALGTPDRVRMVVASYW